VAMRMLKVLCPHVLEIGCFSHTSDRVGETFNVPTLHDFMTYWIRLFAHSPKAKLIWSQQTGINIQGYSATHWWSKWEVIIQILELFDDVEFFIKHDEQFSNSTRAKLAEYFEDS